MDSTVSTTGRMPDRENVDHVLLPTNRYGRWDDAFGKKHVNAANGYAVVAGKRRNGNLGVRIVNHD